MTELEQFLMNQNKELTEQNKKLLAQNEELLSRVSHLTEQVQYMNKKLFGTSSEKSKMGESQLSLFEDHFFEDQRKLRHKPLKRLLIDVKRKKVEKLNLLKDLPSVDIQHRLVGDACQCGNCGEQLIEIGSKIVRTLIKFVPAMLQKERHIEHSYYLGQKMSKRPASN